MKRSTIIEAIIFLYAILFLYTGISKLTDYSIFKEQLSESPVLGPIALLIARTLPWLEFIIVIMLLIPRWRLRGFYAAAILMTAFTIYVIVLLSFNERLPCSCGGIISQLSWRQHIIFNSIFIALSLTGIALQKREKQDNHATWTPSVYYESSMRAK